MGSYNREPEQQENKCPAHGCFMYPSMFVDGGPWCCRYHAKQPMQNWQKVTEILHAQKRILDVIAHADSMYADEFNLLRDKDAFELEDLLKPAIAGKGYPAETFKAWRCRVKDFVYEAIQREIGRISTQGVSTINREVSASVSAFTSGILRKTQRQKSFKSMADSRQSADYDARGKV